MPKWQNCPHSLLASTLTKVAPLRPRGVRAMGTNIHNTHVIYGPLVHPSGVHGWAQHSARRAEKVENCSKWPKMRTLMVGANEAHARLGLECAIGLVSSYMCPTYLLGVAQLLRFWEWQGRQEKDVLELCPRSFDVFLQVGFVVENPKPKQQVEQGLNMDRINEINDWFWNPV